MTLKEIFETKSPLEDLRATLLAYVKQETLGPAKKLGRYLIFGLAGSLLLVLGVILLLLGFLRLLQSQTGSTFTGDLSWIPYLIIAVVGIALTLVSLKAARRKASAKELLK